MSFAPAATCRICLSIPNLVQHLQPRRWQSSLWRRVRSRPARPRPRLAERDRKGFIDQRSDTRLTRHASLSQTGFKRLDLDLDAKQLSDPMRAGKHLRQLVDVELQKMRDQLRNSTFCLAAGLEPKTSDEVFEAFEHNLRQRMEAWPEDPRQDPVYQRLSEARQEVPSRIGELLKFWLQHHVTSRRLGTRPMLSKRLRELVDFRNPFDWYPDARRLRRKFHLHVGPTNSGKTYNALKRLEQAKTGVYAGPLRLLAHEIYQRLNAKGKLCALMTGDERLLPPDMPPGAQPHMMSCTVEMVPMNQRFDVAVIDEIQMISHDERGASWTNALLGLQADEIHLCGEERSLELIENFVKAAGDELEVHRYTRLSPLKVQSQTLHGSWKNLRKGDCVIAFSVNLIHALRAFIERNTKKKVAIVYGSLPPEIRAQQAALFNDDESGYDILVASDAVGMGLNLNIKRIIFYSTTKHMGSGVFQPLDVPMVKQIAGRAGRFKIAPTLPSVMASTPSRTEPTLSREPESNAQTLGLVTAMNKEDLAVINRSMDAPLTPLTTAGLVAPDDIFYKFASLFPRGTPFSYILLRLTSTAQLHPMFKLNSKRDIFAIADLIEQIPDLSIQDRFLLVRSPATLKVAGMAQVMLELAKCVAEHRPGRILDIPAFKVKLLDHQGPPTLEYLRELETLHKSLTVYNWLSYRYETIFDTRPTAMHIKHLVQLRMDQTLRELGADFQLKLQKDMRRRHRADRLKAQSEKISSSVFPEPFELENHHQRASEPDALAGLLDIDVSADPVLYNSSKPTSVAQEV